MKMATEPAGDPSGNQVGYAFAYHLGSFGRYNQHMVAAIKQTVTVGEGGVIKVRSPELRAGDRAEVIVLVEPQPSVHRPLGSFIGAGRGCFSSVAEVDAYIREQRDEWDR